MVSLFKKNQLAVTNIKKESLAEDGKVLTASGRCEGGWTGSDIFEVARSTVFDIRLFAFFLLL
jgi:hypothetical protein